MFSMINWYNSIDVCDDTLAYHLALYIKVSKTIVKLIDYAFIFTNGYIFMILIMCLNANGSLYIHAHVYEIQGPCSIVLDNESLL